MNKIEMVQNYINEQIKENGMDEQQQIKINFSDICEEKDVIEAAEELGYCADNTDCTEGTWWIYKEI